MTNGLVKHIIVEESSSIQWINARRSKCGHVLYTKLDRHRNIDKSDIFRNRAMPPPSRPLFRCMTSKYYLLFYNTPVMSEYLLDWSVKLKTQLNCCTCTGSRRANLVSKVKKVLLETWPQWSLQCGCILIYYWFNGLSWRIVRLSNTRARLFKTNDVVS